MMISMTKDKRVGAQIADALLLMAEPLKRTAY
jgi:hypothetical protein